MDDKRPSRGTLALRWRLTIWIALAFAATVAGVFVLIWITVTSILADDIKDDLEGNYRNVYGRAVVAGEERYQDVVDDYAFPVAIYDVQGRLLAANGEADANVMRVTELQAVEIVVEKQQIEEDVDIGGATYRLRAGSLRGGNEVLGIVQVGRSIQTAQDIREAMLQILIIGGAVSLGLVLVVGYWLARGAMRPVERVADVAEEIGASGLTRRLAVKNQPSEVQRLADTFDAMLARLEAAFQQQRNFVMDVSHELRTPLAGLRGNLDVMLMDPDLDAETKQQLEKMSAEVSRLIRLTSNLLYMAHAEAGREVARRPVDMDELCLEVVHQEQNVRRDVILRFDHEEHVSMAGDRDLLKQLLLNVVDNAVKFSPPDGEVLLTLAGGDSEVEISVQDQGPGIPGDQMDRIFERFHRGAQGGSRTVGGAGIGLAISRWIARAHGGDIRVESNGAGSRFVITLPRADRAA